MVTGNKLAIDHLKLPIDAKATPDILEVKFDFNEQPVFRTPKGQIVASPDTLENPVIILNKFYLPNDLQKLDSLPSHLPVLVRDGNHLLELKKGAAGLWQLRSGNVHIDIPDHTALSRAMAHLNAPWGYHKVKILDSQASQSTPHATFKLDTLLKSPHQYKGQTLVMGGALDKLYLNTPHGKAELSTLQTLAKEQDITLLILDTPTPLPAEKLATQLDKISGSNTPMSTGAFLSHFHAQGPAIRYQITDSQNGQTFIRSLQTVTPPTDTTLDMAQSTGTLSNVAIRSSLMIRPDEERRNELDNRIVPWLPSPISFYLIISIAAGYLFFGTCRQLLRYFWPLTLREDFSPKWLYSGYRLIRLVVLLSLIMPLFGLPCAVWRICYTVYRVLRWITLAIHRLILWVLSPLRG